VGDAISGIDFGPRLPGPGLKCYMEVFCSSFYWKLS